MRIQEQINQNKAKTWVIMAVFSVVVGCLVWIFALAMGYQGNGAIGYVGIGLLITGIINFASYFFSDRLVLALTGAKEISKNDFPELFGIIENLTRTSRTPIPKVYMVNDPSPNAFATGRDPDHAVVAVHSGILERLDKGELEGVLAHELSHVRNYDTRVMAIVSMLAGTVALLADFFMRSLWFGGNDRENKNSGIFIIVGIVAAIIAPIAAQLIRLSVSRRREFLADASGAALTHYPEGLARALEKISSYTAPSKTASTATAHLYISNPLGGGKKNAGSWLASLFNTHPPIEERVRLLRRMH